MIGGENGCLLPGSGGLFPAIIHFTFSNYERPYDQILEAIKKTYRGSMLHGSNRGNHASFLMDESGERVDFQVILRVRFGGSPRSRLY